MFKNISLSFITLYFTLTVLFFAVIGILYSKQNYIENYQLKENLLYTQIELETSNILNIVLNQYKEKKNLILSKHNEVLKYLKNKPIDTNLTTIFDEINIGFTPPIFNIYLTDENLVIRNSTFKNDIGFDLSFAKDTFEKHKKNNIISVSAPILEATTNKFFSFSDSYLPYPYDKNILQISYTYSGFKQNFAKLNSLVDSNQNIKDIKAYLYLKQDNFTADFYFKKYNSNKPTLKELENRIETGKKLSKLCTNRYIEKEIIIDHILFKEIIIVSKSSIYDDSKIIYSILFDQSNYKTSLKNYNIILVLLFIISLVLLILLSKIKNNERKYKYQDRFVKQSIHEIKTPLSIISLNNELRALKYGKDSYSDKINNAIKTLNNSYDVMTYLMIQDQEIYYSKKDIDIIVFLKNRIDYFRYLFKANNKNIKLLVKNNSLVLNISEIELERFIDNNLSNCLKYSFENTTTIVSLKYNILSFETKSNNINNSSKIFDKYIREDNIKGGFGLGLNIIKIISIKYNFKYEVISANNITIFKYTL